MLAIRNSFIILPLTLLVPSMLFASYEAQTKQIDNMIASKQKTMKSKEKLEIPDYGVDTISYERLSKIRNIFDLAHELPFERAKELKRQSQVKKVEPVKEIVVPPELQKIMGEKVTLLRQQPASSFKFKGLVSQDNNEWGVLELNSNKKLYFVKKKDLLGQNYGQVENVDKKGVTIGEWTQNPTDRAWKKNNITIQ